MSQQVVDGLRSRAVRSEEDSVVATGEFSVETSYTGELTFGKSGTQPATPIPSTTTPPLVAIETTVEFWDATGGKSVGRALPTVTHPPERAR